MSQDDTQVFMECEKRIKEKYNAGASGQGIQNYNYLRSSLADYFEHFTNEKYDDYPDQQLLEYFINSLPAKIQSIDMAVKSTSIYKEENLTQTDVEVRQLQAKLEKLKENYKELIEEQTDYDDKLNVMKEQQKHLQIQKELNEQALESKKEKLYQTERQVLEETQRKGERKNYLQ